jgi:hypothetical protein
VVIIVAALSAFGGAWFLVAGLGVLTTPIAEPGTWRESLIIGCCCFFVTLTLWGFAAWLIW